MRLHPGYCGAQDTFYVGNLKGVGRVYQQTFIDTYAVARPLPSEAPGAPLAGGNSPSSISLPRMISRMPLSPDDRAELERRGVDNIRQRLDHAGAGSGSVVPGLGPNFGMTRRT